ncbi:Pyrimidine-specific ribonucleoside hydrolase RihA (Cytidine/uridine-specific hydrolase), partial [Durusdinium trenchii]
RPQLLSGIDNLLSRYVPLPFNWRPPSWMYASKLLLRSLRRQQHPVDLIVLGPLTSLAEALQKDEKLLRQKIRQIYFSGGQVDPPDAPPPVQQVWPYSAGGTSFTGNPPFTAWNLFADPVAANSIFSFGLPIVLATDSFQYALPFYRNDTQFIPKSCGPKTSEFLHQLVEQIPKALNESLSLVMYWDQSTAVLAVQMIWARERYGAQAAQQALRAPVCARAGRQLATMMMEAGDNSSVSGGRYARLLENEFGRPVTSCLQSHERKFKTAYYTGVCGFDAEG